MIFRTTQKKNSERSEVKFKLRVDGVQVKNISENAKNTGHCSEFPLHKNFKLVLEQNVTNQAYHKVTYRSQKCLVQSLNQQLYLVN